MLHFPSSCHTGLIRKPFATEKRLARYPLLFQQVLRYTDDDDPDATDLKLAIRNAQLTLARTNENLKMHENEEKLAYLSEHLSFPDNETVGLDLTAPTRNGERRLLLKEGELLKGYNHRRQSKRRTLHAYLFNDMLLLTSRALGIRERFAGMNAVQDPDAIFVYKTVRVR